MSKNLVILVLLFVLALLIRSDHSNIQAQGFTTAERWRDFFCTNNEQCDVGDFDGDGRDDIIDFIAQNGAVEDKGKVWVSLSNGQAFESASLWAERFCMNGEHCDVGDFNGDDRDDIVSLGRHPQAGTAQVRLSTGSGFSDATQWLDAFCTSGMVCQIGDVNGDGRDDIVAISSDSDTSATQGAIVALSISSSFVHAGTWSDLTCDPEQECIVGDVTGDGKDDIIVANRASTHYPRGLVQVAVSNGDSFASAEIWHPNFCRDQEGICSIGDVDGDSLADLVEFVRDGDPNKRGRVHVAFSSGQQLGQSILHNPFFCIGDELCRTGDFDGDGRIDLIDFIRGDSNTLNQGNVFVSLSKITDANRNIAAPTPTLAPTLQPTSVPPTVRVITTQPAAVQTTMAPAVTTPPAPDQTTTEPTVTTPPPDDPTTEAPQIDTTTEVASPEGDAADVSPGDLGLASTSGGMGGAGSVTAYVNANQQTDSVTLIEMSLSNGTPMMHWWGSCSPTDCDNGTHAGSIVSQVLDGPNIVEQTWSFFVVQPHANSSFTLYWNAGSPNTIALTVYTEFTDGSGREPYTRNETMVRQ